MSIEPFKADTVETTEMPNGHHDFSVGGGSIKRWSTYKGHVRFYTKLDVVPSDISLSAIEFDGLANLVVTGIGQKGFSFMVTANSSNKGWGITAVSFDWEAIA